MDPGIQSRRTILATTAALATAAIAGCQGNGDDPGGNESNGEDGGELPSESDVEPVIQTYIERDSASEAEAVIHPDSTIVATDPQAEWELTRIKTIEEAESGGVLVEYSAQRQRDGVYTESGVILRERDGEWLVYENQ